MDDACRVGPHGYSHGWIKDGPGAREKQLAGMDPGSRALALAQEETRRYHPKLATDLGTPQQAGGLLQNWLKRGGHPRADEAYVARHSDPNRQSSNAGRGPDGEPMVALHKDRWDYGTLAHETAHLLHDQETGRQVNGPEPPGGIHGPGFLAHYSRLLGGISKGAGEDLMAAHAEHLREGQKASRVDTWAERFNTVHIPAGNPTGGQFGTSGGGSSAKSGAKAPAKAPAKAAPPAHHMSAAHAAEKAKLLAEAHKDAAEARKLEQQLAGLEKQAATAQAAAKKSAASAKASLKAGHVVHHRKHAAHHKAHASHHLSLKKRIAGLKAQIHALREKAAGLEKQANAIRSAGAVTNPGGTERLHEYWVHGPGAAKIRWGEPNDFDRCVEHLGKFMTDPKGYCNLAHKAATGMYPAQHAAEMHAGRAGMATDTKAPYGTSVDYGDPGYLDADGNQASASGKPGVKRYPLSADKVMAAWSYINQAKNAGQYTPSQLSAIKGRIRSAMDKHGHDVMDKPAPAVARVEAVFDRIWDLEDIRIISRAQGDGTGRLVEAYAAVFNVPAEIHDQHGDYNEENDPGSFNRSIDHAARASRTPFRCIYNHGMTLHGTPAERFSIPIGTPEEVRAESRGLLTRTLYNKTPLADEILEAISSGGITAQSYTGRILRSSPELRRGEKYRPGRDGRLITVRRLELALREYGPTPFPAFSGAEILGVRMSTPGEFTPDPDETEEALPPDEEPAAGDPPPPEGEEHSARYHQHALYTLRSREAREAAGLVW